jgi:hypothetical protein
MSLMCEGVFRCRLPSLPGELHAASLRLMIKTHFLCPISFAGGVSTIFCLSMNLFSLCSPTIRSAYKPLIDLVLSSTFLTPARPFDLPGTPLTQPSKLPLSNFHHPRGQQQPHPQYFDRSIDATHHGSRNYLRYQTRREYSL